MTHNIELKKSPEEQLARENEILSKTVLEIMLRFSEKVSWSWKEKRTDEQIKEILSQPDWKEKTKFVAKDYYHNGEYKGECIGHWWSAPWLVDAREPIEIIENLKKDNEKEIWDITHYHSEQLEEKKAKIGELEKRVKELEEFSNWLQRELKEAWSEGETHIEAMHYAGELAKREESNLTKQIGVLENAGKEILEALVKTEKQSKGRLEANENLQQELRGQKELLTNSQIETREQIKNNEELKEQNQTFFQLYLDNKPLPKTPSKFKIFKGKVKNKFQQLVKRKSFHQEQKLVAKIEVPVK